MPRVTPVAVAFAAQDIVSVLAPTFTESTVALAESAGRPDVQDGIPEPDISYPTQSLDTAERFVIVAEPFVVFPVGDGDTRPGVVDATGDDPTMADFVVVNPANV